MNDRTDCLSITNRWLQAFCITALAALGGASGSAVANPAFGNPGGQNNIDPAYNVCRGVTPDCYNAWYTDRDDRVLVYSRTAGPRHANLGRRLDPDHPSNAGLNLPRPYVITDNHDDPAAYRFNFDAFKTNVLDQLAGLKPAKHGTND